MADVGRITPTKIIWPEPHRDPLERQREEQQEKEAEQRDEPRQNDPSDDGPEAPADGHIDEYA
ncbi:MAG: hypothetical protein M0R77_13530 [Gammaproteobacteria bacterium]|nr:hypothetical protein [Gammaproteobacteria bacterium]